jgi:CRISPR type III-A-associated protein Csm2
MERYENWLQKWEKCEERWEEWSYEGYKEDLEQILDSLMNDVLNDKSFSGELREFLGIGKLNKSRLKKDEKYKEETKKKWKVNFVQLLLKCALKDSKGKESLLKELYKERNLYSPEGLTSLFALAFGNLKSTQLRKVFDSLKNLKDDLERMKKGLENTNILTKLRKDIYSVYPLLAYAQGRALIPREFYELLVFLLNRLENLMRKIEEIKEDCSVQEYYSELINELDKFVSFIHSFLAYHKFYHGNK